MFSTQCIENGELKPFTRDIFSSCIKATYCELEDKPYPILKNPKDGGFKKSQKGCFVVKKNEMGELTYQDEYTWEDACSNSENELVSVFQDGKRMVTQSLSEIRNILHDRKF